MKTHEKIAFVIIAAITFLIWGHIEYGLKTLKNGQQSLLAKAEKDGCKNRLFEHNEGWLEGYRAGKNVTGSVGYEAVRQIWDTQPASIRIQKAIEKNVEQAEREAKHKAQHA